MAISLDQPQGAQASLRTRVTSSVERIRTDALAMLGAVVQAGLFDRQRDAQLPGDLVHRITWVVPEDALADGWRVDEEEEQGVTAADDERWGLQEELVQVGGMARKGDGTHGGAYLWVVLAQDEDYSTPLVPREGGYDIAAIHAIGTCEAVAVEWESDPREKNWSRPRMYQLTPSRSGLTWRPARVHASRLIYVPGLRRPRDDSDTTQGEDWSALKVYREAIQGVDQGWRSSARLLERRSIPWVRLLGGRAMRSADDGSSTGFVARMLAFKESFNVDRMAVLTEGEETGWTSPAVSGTSDLIAALGWRMSIPEGIPGSKLFGTAPAGLTSDDEAATKTYNALLNNRRDNDYAPALLAIYTIALGPSDERTIHWPPLDEPTAKEQAETEESRMRTDVGYLAEGVLDATEVRRDLMERERYALESEEPPELDEPEVPFGLPMPPGMGTPIPPGTDDADGEDEAEEE